LAGQPPVGRRFAVRRSSVRAARIVDSPDLDHGLQVDVAKPLLIRSVLDGLRLLIVLLLGLRSAFRRCGGIGRYLRGRRCSILRTPAQKSA
jgi:hypothetical protein